MREITQGDIRAAARVMLAHPQDQWQGVMQQMLYQAHCADCCRKALGVVHPRLGNGTLMSVALARQPVSEPLPSDQDYLVAIQAVIAAVLDWRAGRQR
ncbi:hypothetical protein LY56_01208 [Roseinatronobacter thiooxidans]|uniref:DUF7742 domain-containing protein n=1 Tax=Roseinatronobacter thiooxidans TaxID=121821 RepID=A0A2W7QFS1_9RHOB|nr:hypothetical protein [Roseinatronobacter thiooxidans]PZX46236.1 hypothetical protein LY56_01208 [Roseinatronobacter thiooxidans]